MDHRLIAALPHLLRESQKRLDAAAYRLTHPGAEIVGRRNAVGLLAQRLAAPLPPRLREGRLRVENFAARLEAVSYAAVLARGFALVTNAKGVPVASAAQVSPGAALTIKFSDGDVAVKAAPVQGSLPL